MLRIGVLALQGSVIEHMKMLSAFDDIEALEVRTRENLKNIDGIILPGGESTAIGKLLKDFDLFNHLKSRIEGGMPVWGSCAGMILLAKEIVDEEPHLGVMDIKVRRNAYGTQIDSFTERALIPKISMEPVKLVFIRAPWIESVKNNVDVLCDIRGHIVAARQRNMFVTSFHPELTDDLSVHGYFISMASGSI